MDEADLLGDRIAIISQGKLKACGSSLFLKSHFGQGYSLRLVREDPIKLSAVEPPKTNGVQLNKTPRQADILRNFVKKVIPECTLLDDVGSEVVLLLPYSTVQHFPALFLALDTNLKDLNITSYGISDTTLEDVFLKITIGDIETNADSFHSLSSSCKRRVTEILKRMKTCSKKVPLEVHPIHPAPSALPVQPPNSKVANTVAAEPVVNHSPNPARVSAMSIAAINQENGNIQRIEVESSPPLEVLEELVAKACPSVNGADGPRDCLLEEGGSSAQDDEFPVRSTGTNRSCCCMALIQIGFIYFKRLRNSARNKKAMFFEVITFSHDNWY